MPIDSFRRNTARTLPAPDEFEGSHHLSMADQHWSQRWGFWQMSKMQSKTCNHRDSSSSWRRYHTLVSSMRELWINRRGVERL